MEKKAPPIYRIALIGPESTGKSILSEQLANHYKTVWIPEYSRSYLKNINRPYTLEDVITITKKQFEQEQEALQQANRFIFADTELIIAKVWCEDVFGLTPDWIQQTLIKNPYDFYLLTSPDLPWLPDPLRENPHRRTYFFDWYERELNKIHAAYTVIKGEGALRLENAIAAIQKKFNC